MTGVGLRPSVISSGAKQNREIPLHYAACLYCQERYSPHFCLIFCHLISIVYILSSNFWRLTSLYPQISDPLGTSYRLSLKRGACHWIFSCCYLTISPLSKEALIQSLSAFILEFLCNARNGTTRIASYLRSPMTKQCIKILIKAGSMN